jgi:penicillin-binding protein 2
MMQRKMKKMSRSGGMEIEDHIFSVTENESAKIEMPFEKKKLKFFWWIILVFLIFLASRVFYLNIIRGSFYQDLAKRNSIRSIVMKAPRGKIFDIKGSALVSNIPSLDAVFIPADLPKDEEIKKRMIEKLSNILGINSGEIIAKIESVESYSFNSVLLKENISQDESLVLMESSKEFPGIIIEKTAIRDYADSSIFSHILGYVGKVEKKELESNAGYLFTDYIGKQGIEKSYEKYLRGVNGAVQVEVDSLGNIKKERGIIDSKQGSDLVLNIDADLQKKITDSLTAMLEKTKTNTAAAIAIDPRDGSILSLVSLPSYDNNLFSQKISQDDYLKLIKDPDKPLFNRAIAGEYPPGSTIKPLIASAALEEGTIDENTTVSDSGSISIGNFVFRDWKTHGLTDVRKAIAESCDVFFYSVGGGYGNIPGLGMSRMKKYDNLFGLGKITGIDITGEADGLIPDEKWKLETIGEKWFVGNSYHAAIGQGYVTATPLQLINYIAAIANGGTVYEPHIVNQIRKNDKETISISQKIINEKFISPATLKIVQEGMRQTVTSGTAQTLKSLPVEVAGKTGTAQFGSENRTHAWFVSYAPYVNPKIAMVVLVEGGGEGHSSALPVTQEVLDWYFRNQ